MSDYVDDDPFWVQNRAEFLAKRSTSADPSACGTCRGKAEAGEPVEHDECQQRATILHAPDHPYYEILAGFSLEENAKLPARFHVPVFDDCGKPNSWLCAVCWEEGVVSGWPCATAIKYGKQVFTPLHEAETAQKKQTAELAAYRALDLGDLDGRVSASCGNPEHPTWLRAPDDSRGCPWCRIAELEVEVSNPHTPRLCICGHSRLAHTVPAPHSCFALGQTCPCPTYRQLPHDEAEEQFKRNLRAAEARQHFDSTPDPADGCHWCACGNRWPCKNAGEAAA